MISRRLTRVEDRYEDFQKRLDSTRNRRLFFGAISFVALVFLSSSSLKLLFGFVFVAGLLPFFYYVFQSKNQLKHLELLHNWLEFLRRLNGRQNGKPPASVRVEELPAHQQAHARDLHLVGQKSVIGLIDESFSEGGQKRLMHKLLNSLNSVENIQTKQQSLKTLTKFTWVFERFAILGHSAKVKIQNQTLVSLLQNSLLGPRFFLMSVIQLLLWPTTWTMLVLALLDKIAMSPMIPLTGYLLFNLFARSQLNNPFGRAQGFEGQLKILFPLFNYVEARFKHPQLRSLCPQIMSDTPSRKLKKLAGIISGLSVQANPLVYILINALSPWDYIFTFRLERWRQQTQKLLPAWLEELEAMDELASQVIFSKHLGKTWPQFSQDNSATLKFKALYHPLIPINSVVANDFTWPEDKNLLLITGSNMSGKSTFLRTVGVNQCLALMGLPVFAEDYQTYYAPVRPCLQIMDSLEDGFSTFYYEVRKISEIIEAARSGEKFIFLIDEIFRGTNNRERLIGSRSVILELSQHANVRGMISTHDLELAQLEQEVPCVGNWHFVDDVVDGKMHFSYKIHPGPCPSTNAIKIMKNEGLIIT